MSTSTMMTGPADQACPGGEPPLRGGVSGDVRVEVTHVCFVPLTVSPGSDKNGARRPNQTDNF